MANTIAEILGTLPEADLLVVNDGSDDRTSQLARQLGGNGAAVEHRVLPAGHGLGQADIGLLKDWLARR